MSNDQLTELIERRGGGAAAHRLKLLAARLLARLAPEMAARLTAEQWLEIAERAMEFCAMRTEAVKVEVRPLRFAGQPATALQIALLDRPFVVDSVREYLHQRNLIPALLLHPGLSLTRDSGGAISSFEEEKADEQREAFLLAVLEEDLSEAAREELAREMRARFDEVLAATDDFEAMTARTLAIRKEIAAAPETAELRDFMRWLADGGLIFLGYEKYALDGAGEGGGLGPEPGSRLGILRHPRRDLGSLREFAPALLFAGPPVIVSKSRAFSWVHRLDRMDEVIIRRSVADRTVGFDRFLGLFTSKAASQEAGQVPIARAKLREIIAAEHLRAGSHDYKELMAAANGLPKEELLRASVPELRAELSAILNAAGDREVTVTMLPDRERGIVVVIVMMPRERFSSQVRLQIQEALSRRLGGPPVFYHLEMREGYSARLHFSFAAAPPAPGVRQQVEEDIARLTRTWADFLGEALIAHRGESRGAALFHRYRQAFAPEYQNSTEPAQALVDIEHVEALLAGGEPSATVCPPPAGAHPGAIQLRLYDVGEGPVLSDLMPMLQNFGLRVLSEDVHELQVRTQERTRRAFVLAFLIEPLAGAANPAACAAELAEGLTAIRTGRAENDPLNALVLSAELNWREVAVLRAYLAAAFQMQLGPIGALQRIFLAHPSLARTLIEVFTALLHPAGNPSPERIERLRAEFIAGLSAIDNLADDRSARRILGLVEATVRTNYFAPPPQPVPYIALKFESARIPDLPDVAPLYEIHVDSPQMQGCHLRAGKVARGGIRASDRAEDFRSEILSLMKTQTVKNAIIVPVGAKGGFVLKGALPATPERVQSAYLTLINAMLDLTDNVIDGHVVHPAATAILDGDDPYLVVAADKGTATFSDLANQIAQARGFWLGDAFASGGSHGYDHKQLGITARGAWESARRHLREIGRDLTRGAPVTMVGIGDMSGDVFGNGLLQSANVKLLAAFDHRHIFIDPDPDPVASFTERKRLFELPRSRWSDYDPQVLSAGGTVVRRGQKVIKLSAQARAALDIAEPELDSDSLIRAILRANVDMLYNGGIGTYVRAGEETDAQVGDHTNDSCRIAARELRAKVVVEGGNLGFTQKARIEYALRGGRINTDAIDNSAGVDLSDHEVNLKILLAPALQSRQVSLEERNHALAGATAEVVELVLRDNRDQALLLSLEQVRGATMASVYREHLSAIEERGLLRRAEEAIPTREALLERHSRYPGLTRPELAVLVAYTKLDLTRRLESAAFIEDPYLCERFLRPYFPAPIATRFGSEIPRHQLRRNLIATSLTNELVDLMGAIFIFGLVRDFDVSAEDAVMAYVVAADTLCLREHAARISARTGEIIAGAELQALLALERATDKAARSILADEQPIRDPGGAVGRLAPVFAALAHEFEGHLADGERERFEQSYRELRSAGLAESDAYPLARLSFANHLIDIVRLSQEIGTAPARVAQAFFALASPIDFALLEQALERVGPEDRWERRAAQDLAAELRWARLRLARALLKGVARVPRSDEIGGWLAQVNPRHFAQAQHVLADLRSVPTASLAALSTAVRALGRLAAAIPAPLPQG